MIESGTRPATFELGPAERIPLGEGRTFRIGATTVAVFRTRSGEVFATQPTCPHRGGPLADGLIGSGRVICPLHSFVFDLATGRSASGDCEALRTYPVSVSPEGCLVVRIEE